MMFSVYIYCTRKHKVKYGQYNIIHLQLCIGQFVCSLCCPYVGVMDDIEQGFGQVQSDSKDLKQLQLEQTKIKVLYLHVSMCVYNSTTYYIYT